LRLLQLRNPWGKFSWNGDWSERSPLWTHELKSKLLLNNNSKRATSKVSMRNTDKGVFWMSLDDFCKFFCSIDICKTRVNFFENRMSGFFKAEGPEMMQAYLLAVFETSEIDIGLFHKTMKNRKENSDLDLAFIVTRQNNTVENGTVGKLVCSSQRQIRKFVGCDHIFEPGQYLIVPVSFNFWYTKNTKKNKSNDSKTSATTHQRPHSSTSSSNDSSDSSDDSNENEIIDAKYNNLYNLVIHSQKTFFLEQNEYPGTMLADSIIQLCLSKGIKTSAGLDNALVYSLQCWAGLVIMAENSNDSFLHIELDCSKSSNVVSTRQTLLTRDSIP
jgi:calpain-15